MLRGTVVHWGRKVTWSKQLLTSVVPKSSFTFFILTDLMRADRYVQHLAIHARSFNSSSSNLSSSSFSLLSACLLSQTFCSASLHEDFNFAKASVTGEESNRQLTRSSSPTLIADWYSAFSELKTWSIVCTFCKNSNKCCFSNTVGTTHFFWKRKSAYGFHWIN